MVSRGHRRSQNSLTELYAERDHVAWYWSVTAFAASWLILGGLLVFPQTFDDESKITVTRQTLMIYAIAALVAGFSLTIMLCFTCGSWLFRMDRIFLPSVTSSSLGLINIIYNLTIKPNPKLNTNFAAAVSLASIATVLYGTAAIFTFRKISRVRKPRKNYSALSPWQDDALWIPEDERTRQQLLRLLLKPGPDKAPSPAATQDTFRIDLPDPSAEERDANGYLTMPRNVYEARSRSNSGATRELSPWERLQARERPDGSPRPEGRPPSREDRRVEIEMNERSYGDVRGYTTDGVNFTPRINRVQTEGWQPI